MDKPAAKRRRGRPRNQALDALQSELAVSRRHARTILRDMKSKPTEASENSSNSPSPLAGARLMKVQKEIQFLEIRIRTLELEQRALENELLYAEEAKELVNAAVSPLVERLRTLPKILAPRLVGQPQKAVEQTLLDTANELLALARVSVERFNAKARRSL